MSIKLFRRLSASPERGHFSTIANHAQDIFQVLSVQDVSDGSTHPG